MTECLHLNCLERSNVAAMRAMDGESDKSASKGSGTMYKLRLLTKSLYIVSLIV